MPNQGKHIKAGLLVGACVGGVANYLKQNREMAQVKKQEFEWGEFAGCILAGALLGTLGGALPDIIEPATNPHHRSFFHSIASGVGLSIGTHKIVSGDWSEQAKFCSATISAGYLSHLFLDSQTPFGLPFIK